MSIGLSTRRALVAAMLGAAVGLAGGVGHAALTSNEKGQLRDYFAAARPTDVEKVRALVARTDLTSDESAAALAEAFTPVAFTEQHGTFLRELVFGGASAPSRPVVALATVKGLLARAETLHQRYVGGLDHEPKAIAELVAIYGWIDSAIANAGKPTSAEHDPTAGIPAATYEEASKAVRAHIEQNARWLKGDGPVPASIVRLRAQAQVALVDMLPASTTRRVDAADRLGLNGARRAMLTETGILFADDGKIDEAGAQRVRQLLAKLPGARVDLGIICVGDGPGPALRARGEVVTLAHADEPYPFAGEAAPKGYDPVTSAIAHELAVVVALRALDNRWSQLRLQADRDTIAMGSYASRVLGRPRAPSVEHVVGAAAHALLVDAPKALDVAAARAASGDVQSIALVSDALGVLAAPPEPGPETRTGPSSKLELGKANGWTTASALRVAPNGAVVGFTLDGHAWSIDRASPSYVVLSVRRDGQTVATGPGVKPPAPPAKPAPKAAAKK